MSKSYEDPALEIVRMAQEQPVVSESEQGFEQEVERLAQGYRRASDVIGQPRGQACMPGREGSAHASAQAPESAEAAPLIQELEELQSRLDQLRARMKPYVYLRTSATPST